MRNGLSRARALRERYELGEIGITHENIAGVKVVWVRKTSAINGRNASQA